jgi:hypothetical protein
VLPFGTANLNIPITLTNCFYLFFGLCDFRDEAYSSSDHIMYSQLDCLTPVYIVLPLQYPIHFIILYEYCITFQICI